MDRHSVRLDANPRLLEERPVRLPTKSFWLSMTAVQIVTVSVVILFGEELKALIGV